MFSDSLVLCLSACVCVCFCLIFSPPLWEGLLLTGSPVYVYQAELQHHQALQDPSMADENVGLLGEEGMRPGGQALRLG